MGHWLHAIMVNNDTQIIALFRLSSPNDKNRIVTPYRFPHVLSFRTKRPTRSESGLETRLR
jgi:hypothetical protein